MKTCKQCAVEFPRNPKESQAQWDRREFCGRGCSNTWRAKHGPKKVHATKPCAQCGKPFQGAGACCSGPCRQAAWYERNRESALAVRREWREKNPDYFKQPEILSKALERATAKYHGDATLPKRCFARDGGACKHCGATERLHAHHVDGDRTHQTLDNLLTLCGSCHNRVHKAAKRTGRPVSDFADGVPSS